MIIEEVNEELNIDLPVGVGDFETLAGFMLDTLGHIPLEGEQIERGNLRLEVTAMDHLKIETVRITRNVNSQGRPRSS